MVTEGSNGIPSPVPAGSLPNVLAAGMTINCHEIAWDPLVSIAWDPLVSQGA